MKSITVLMDASPKYWFPSSTCTDAYHAAATRSTKKHFTNKDGVVAKSLAAGEDSKTTYGIYRGKTT